MQLQEIDKATYRKHANIVIGSFIAGLVILSLTISFTLIAYYGQTPVEGAESTGNFRFNLAGVIAAALICSAILFRLRNHPFLAEVYYIWRLKQLTNRIYRKLAKVKVSADENNQNALVCLTFYYTALRQIYLLDDNTLTLQELDRNIETLNSQISSLGISVSTDQFTPELLKGF
ncbi:DUF3087 domain-containing protein [Endozoicomonas sp. OPT23]|uniref:DUF3087 domain-containing protein n=1 Tax=Endozoicomonas sp. OPT23 TaxID=2072845 RepID=UPI00129BE86C|nr:DUF3087 domain-containing protein [Endozoicomonas sp. OPT23]MRI31744.1 DUF3087 domain-containing protein [Endozoicomonas sp. OPT23]